MRVGEAFSLVKAYATNYFKPHPEWKHGLGLRPQLAESCIAQLDNMARQRFDAEISGQATLYALEGRSFVLLPKHQYMWDIPLEGIMLRDEIDTLAFYAMKQDGIFTKAMIAAGAIPTPRTKDLKALPKEKRSKAIQEMRAEMNLLVPRIAYILGSTNLPLVYHPEGERVEGANGNIEINKLAPLLKAQEILDLENKLSNKEPNHVPMVPLRIEYDGKPSLERVVGVRMTVGEPFTLSGNGSLSVDQAIERLKRDMYI